MRNIVAILILMLGVGVSIHAQPKEKNFGWDLTYSSILRDVGAADKEWVSNWLKVEKSAAPDWIERWKGQPIISSVLIDFPAFHAAERTTIWLVRTKNGAVYRERVEASRPHEKNITLSTEVYDHFYEKALLWQQHKPRPADEIVEGAILGYMGFLSIFGRTGSRQMLLTLDDFVICIDIKKGCEPGPDKLKSGRVLEALDPIF